MNRNFVLLDSIFVISLANFSFNFDKTDIVQQFAEKNARRECQHLFLVDSSIELN